jgi:hypothetical protein
MSKRSQSRTVRVTVHAVAALRRRRYDDRDYDVIEREIEDCVRLAICEGRVANHKPREFRLYREKGRELADGQRFVWTEEGDLGWLIKRESQKEVVLTTLVRAQSRESVA